MGFFLFFHFFTGSWIVISKSPEAVVKYAHYYGTSPCIQWASTSGPGAQEPALLGSQIILKCGQVGNHTILDNFYILVIEYIADVRFITTQWETEIDDVFGCWCLSEVADLHSCGLFVYPPLVPMKNMMHCVTKTLEKGFGPNLVKISCPEMLSCLLPKIFERNVNYVQNYI